MNDFTKAELELIFRMFHHFVYSPYWKISDNEHELKDKIQSMIDNYCEHEPHGDFHVCVDKCRKCGVIVNDVD